MAPSVKLSAILALILFGGWGTSYLIDMGMPDYQTIQTTVSNKFGEDYKSYFVDSDYEKNDAWWEWSYKYRWLVDFADETKKTKLSDNFKEEKITRGYATTESNSLNKACKEAYAKTENDIKGVSNYSDNIWRYCSIGGTKPLTLEEINDTSSYTTNNLGKTKKSVLISTDDKYDDTNKWFWNLKQIEFFGLNGQEATGDKEDDGSYFKKFYNDNKNRYLGREHISKACKEAYTKDASTDKAEDKPREADVLRFCTLKGK